ncbi:uncharacterized protein PAC_07717 [Phialocephala subalpina]|uniref:Rhodopsin domain-containing protein n=1 Tax=Phialocephala subalpina TaxID=576137 RepID=A0A1L7WYI3_9HELO|nr:uncharacterized protein PAC_07717 [Phialocephala subalpina]
MLCFAMYTISGLFSIRYGVGSEPSQVDNNRTLSAALEWWFLAELFSVLAAALLRISATLHMRKLAETDAQQYLILFIGTGTTIYSASFFLLQLFQCTPIHFFWTGWLGAEGRCMDQQRLAKMEYVFTVVGAGTDWVLAVVPVWLLWGTDLSRKSRSRIRVLILIGLILGILALSLAAYRPILPGFSSEPDRVPVPKLPPPIPEEFKTPTKGYGDLGRMGGTGVQMSPRSASFRKMSCIQLGKKSCTHWDDVNPFDLADVSGGELHILAFIGRSFEMSLGMKAKKPLNSRQAMEKQASRKDSRFLEDARALAKPNNSPCVCHLKIPNLTAELKHKTRLERMEALQPDELSFI